SFEEILNAITMVGLSFIFAFVLVIPVIKFVPKTKAFQKLVLDTSETKQEGFRSTPETYEQFVGAEGVALSALRPSGIGIFKDQRLNIIAEGEFIDANNPVKIVKVEGYRIIVRKIA
ncbi:MAG: nodulation protein NfeD, partial [bacterium]